MLGRTAICLILLVFLPGIIDGRICRQHCNCKSLHAQIDKVQSALNHVSKDNNDLLRKNIQLGSDFALRVSYNGNTVGYIYDDYRPSMTIPPNSQIEVVHKNSIKQTDTPFIRVFYDAGNNGLFTDLPIPGNYNVSQIGLPPRSISSINIPNGFQAILYAEDNFQGDHIVLTHSSDNLHKFNDRTQSIEIIEIFTKKEEHVAVVYSHPQYSGKQKGLIIGNNTITSLEMKSIMIDIDYEVLIYSNDVLIHIVRSKDGVFGNSRCVQINSPNTIFNVVVQKISEDIDKYIVFYEDIDFKGPHFIVNANSTISITNADGKLSSIRIHPEYELVLYDQPNFQGNYIVVSGDINNLNFYAFNDRTMSILIRPKNDNHNVAIYTKPNYMGQSMIVPIGLSDCALNKLLNFCDSEYAGSIKVPIGFRATIIKKSTIILNERILTYTEDSPNIQSYIDSLITSILVEKI
jgi:hypothetical protein